MARGESGRIVIEVDPRFKAELHDALSRRGTTMKAWFVREAMGYLADHNPAVRSVAESVSHPYQARDTADENV